MKLSVKYISRSLMVLALVLGLVASSWADTWVFRFPTGQTKFVDKTGATHTADSAGLVSTTNVSLVKNFLDAGFTLQNANFAVASHDYAAGTTAWTLSDKENACMFMVATNAGGGVDAIASATNGKFLIVYNNSGQVVTVKASGQTGVAVANAATAMLRGNGTDFVALPVSGGAGSFTTLAASGAVALSPANANVVASPTGSGVVTINPASAGTVNNVSVGATTPLAGTFTTFGHAGLLAASHDYEAGNADWTLSAAEGRAKTFTTTNAAVGGCNAIIPAGFVGVFFVNNTSGQTVTWKYTASTGIANATAKKQILVADGTEVYSLKADY